MILNFDLSKDEGLALSINKVVKDEYVCKKYVFQSVDEITDVPFLSDQFIKMPQFDYDQEFKSGILNFNTIND
ncbi:ABC-three component system middle component 1 [Virgibacillus sp. MG-45]|uniref:ABC-three component system middle component 1 n=1 Tax=Virgibacillus sp. MG-45 TaxID=3102791 RepID=UPI003FCD1F15